MTTEAVPMPVQLPVHEPKCEHIYRFDWVRYASFCIRCGDEK